MNQDKRPTAQVAGRTVGGGELFLIAGPCVIESRQLAFDIAGQLKDLAQTRDLFLVFKASFDKANRTSLDAERGPGLGPGLELLGAIRASTGLPVLTDVHLPEQCAPAAEVVDVLQIPAFLCRQTDLLLAAAATGRAVNVKKGQFLAPWDMLYVANKVKEAGNPNVIVTERGIAINPQRRDLMESLKGSTLPIRTIEEIKNEVEDICGGPAAKPDLGEKVVAAIKWVDGTVIDCVRQVGS